MKEKTKPRFHPAEFLAETGKGRTIMPFEEGKVVFAQGDPATAIFYIRKGKVKVTVVSKSGKEAVIAVLEPSNFFGEGCLAGQPLRMATATAMCDCSITRLDKAIVVEMLHQEPAFSEFLLSYMLTRTIRIEEDLVDQLFNSSEKRLARALLLLANFGKESGQAPIPVTLSQETLAEMIGTTRSRVSYFMNNFRKKGLISYNGQIEVHSSLLDAVLRDKPQIREAE